jgi:hypothetical protein
MNEANSLEQNPAIDPTGMKGWGVDADPENDPTYPMRVRNEAAHEGYTWSRPEQQPEEVEKLHSNERPNLTAVYGTTAPPAGLSGMIRRRAFDYSENSYAHWLPLMLADRVDMIEGVFSDFASGRIPNVFAENGWKAEWQHDPKRVIAKVAIGAAAVGLLVMFLTRSDSDGA